MRRTLRLTKETLSELGPQELSAVVGGQTGECIDPPTDVCVETYRAACLVSRLMYPCPTEPTFVC